MIEIYYRKPDDMARERKITSILADHNGEVTYKETDSGDSICLTAEFDSWENAGVAIAMLRDAGEYVEGPTEY